MVHTVLKFNHALHDKRAIVRDDE